MIVRRGARLRLSHILCVIGVILVFAMLLFPLLVQERHFDQLGDVSKGQTKRLILAAIMYAADNDDYLPLGTAWHTGKEDQLCFPAPAGCFATWAWAVQAYSASPIYPDVTVRDNRTRLSGRDDHFNAFYVDYGYNYTHLSPYVPASNAALSNQQVLSISQLDLADPARTVMIASKWSRGNSPDPPLWGTGFPGGMLLDAAIDPPVCTALRQRCFTNWGIGGFFDRSDSRAGIMLPDSEGHLTGGVALRTREQKAVVGFCDGHADKISAFRLAAGTNWTPNVRAADVVVTDPKMYLWSVAK